VIQNVCAHSMGCDMKTDWLHETLCPFSVVLLHVRCHENRLVTWDLVSLLSCVTWDCVPSTVMCASQTHLT